MYSHYVVVLDWETEDDSDVQILGVAHTLDDAKIIFDKYVKEQKKIAADNGYDTDEDTGVVFCAGILGYWRTNHISLFIQGVN